MIKIALASGVLLFTIAKILMNELERDRALAVLYNFNALKRNYSL